MLGYLKELINANNRVIIPDFGAFILNTGSNKNIVFNEFLKYNDGLLIDYIANKESISKDKAHDKVKQFVTSLRNEINTNKTVTLDGLGNLVLNDSGKLSFKQSSEKQASDEAPDTLNIEPESKATEETTEFKKTINPKADEKKTVAGAGTQKVTSQSTDAKKKELSQTTQTDTGEPAKQNITNNKQTKTQPTQEESKKQQPVKHIERKSSAGAVNYSNDRSSRVINSSRRTRNIIIVVAVNLVIVSFFILRKAGEKKTEKADNPIVLSPQNETKASEITNKNSDNGNKQANQASANAEEDDIPRQIAEELKSNNVQTKQVVSNTNKYYIVAGCFANETNADNFLIKLQSQGYNAEKFGKVRSLHGVSYESYGNRSEALNALRRIRKQTGSDAWLYIKK